MNASLAFQRLLWKEYRVLRQLWAMCGLGVTFLMLVILAVGESSPHMMGYSAAFWAITVWVPPVYLLAALSTMFAGEREEGTLVWLTALSPRLSGVFVSRVLFVLFSGMELQAWYALAALLLSQFDRASYGPVVDHEETLRMMSFLLVESLAYGLLWSLQTRRPLNAILYAAITLILVNSGAAILVEWFGARYSIIPHDGPNYAFSFWGWVRCLGLIAVMAVNWRLAEGWLHGHPWDWEWVAHWWSQRRTKAASGTATPLTTFPRDASEPWRRAWQRLRWLEWQSMKSYAWLTLLFCGASWASILVKFDNHRPTFAFSMIFCWLALIVAGAMAWHGEQTQQRFRALVRLGITPLALWTNKLLCWMLAAAVGMGVIAATTAVLWSALASMSAKNQYLDLQNVTWRQTAELQKHGALAYFVLAAITMFVCAFVSAHLVRRTVIAIGLALMGTGCTLAWMTICGQHAFPLSVFFLPIPVWLLWISVSALPGWWIEQSWRQISLRRGVEISLQAVAPFGLLILAAGYRVWEVPTVPAIDPGAETVYHESINALRKGNVQGTAEGWSNLRVLLSTELIVPSDMTVPADHREDGKHRVPDDLTWTPADFVRGSASSPAARRSLVEANRKTIEALVGQIHSLDALLVTSKFAEASWWNYLYGPLVMYAAQQALEDGKPDVSIRYLQAAVRLTGMLQRFHLSAAVPREHFLREMMSWAQHPAQTEKTLSLGLQACAGELRFWQPQVEELWLQRNEELEDANKEYWLWERARARKLVDVAYSNRLLYLRGCQQNRLRPGFGAEMISHTSPWSLGIHPGDPAFAAWNYQLPMYRYMDYDLGANYAHGFYHGNPIINHVDENRYRVTLARMAVLGYQRLNGQFPSTLFEVEQYFGGHATAMYDVWTRSHFGYAPNGFPLKEPEFPDDGVYRQPLLWTAGPQHFTLELAENRIYRRTDSYGFYSNTLIRTHDEDSHPDWIFPIRPRELMEP